MPETLIKSLMSAVIRLLRPLVRVLLRNGMTYGEFSDLAKWVYVDVADKEFAIAGRKQSVSRISVITGLTRKEVARLQKIGAPEDDAASQQYNRAARVITGWLRDAAFQDGRGQPAPLPFEGETASFTALVKAYSGDMPARAILDELERVGAVAIGDDGRIQLLARGYVPQTGEADKLHILGTDTALLLATIDHNLKAVTGDAYYQRKLAYDNLTAEGLDAFRQLSAAKAQALLEELDVQLSPLDRDVNPDAAGSGRKHAGVGIYYFEEDVTEDS